MKIGRLSAALLILLILASSALTFAHGDEDHGDKKTTVAAGPGLIARTAKVGDYEVTVKHPSLEPLHEHPARVFVTRYATNEPVKDAMVNLIIAIKGKELVKVLAKAAARPGEYEATMPPLDVGTYNFSAAISAGGANGTANYGAVVVEMPKPLAGSRGWAETKNAWLLALVLGLLALVSATGFLTWRRRIVLLYE
jgi:hypothetical protein